MHTDGILNSFRWNDRTQSLLTTYLAMVQQSALLLVEITMYSMRHDMCIVDKKNRGHAQGVALYKYSKSYPFNNVL